MNKTISMDAYDACVEMAKASYYTCKSFLKFQQDLVKESFETAMKEADENGQASWPVDMGTVRNIKTISDRLDFLDRRLDHAVKRLRQKNLTADSLEGLEALCDGPAGAGRTRLRAGLQVVTCAMEGYVASAEGADTIDHEAWRMGVDMAMCLFEYDTALSDETYGFRLEPNLMNIYLCTALCAFGTQPEKMIRNGVLSGKKLDEVFQSMMDQVLETEEGGQALGAVLDRHIENRTGELSGSLAAAQKENADLSKRARSMEDELKRLRKQSARLPAENERLRQSLSDAEQRRTGDAKRIAELEQALEDCGRTISALAAHLPMAGLPELPEKDCMFFGGHVNMTKKIREAHPGWTFVDGTDENFTMPAQAPEMLFIWDRHISHPAWWRLKRAMYGRTRVAYLKSTNPDMLENEMRRGYAAAMAADKDGGEE